MQVACYETHATPAAWWHRVKNIQICANAEALKSIKADMLILPHCPAKELVQEFRSANPAALILVGSVTATLDELSVLLDTTLAGRFNNWPGCVEKGAEAVISTQYVIHFTQWFEEQNIPLVMVADEPGLIAPRVIARIINEAYLAFEEKVSTMEAIDLAMKLGTNYPYGPFEWAHAIGIPQVLQVLESTAVGKTGYSPAPLLCKSVQGASA